jgi:carbon-monoxide dehydrogenase medium subunit
MHETYEYHRPGDVKEVCRLLAELPEAQVLAGGTDLLYDIVAGLRPAQHVVSLQGVDELKQIEKTADGLSIGAACTALEVQRSPLVQEFFPELAEMVVKFACPQVRSRATVAGNICSAVPCGDFPVILIALGAHVELVFAGGSRTIPLVDFFSGPRETSRKPDELLARIHVRRKEPKSGACFLKFQRRASNSLAVASVASFLALDHGMCRDARIVLGSVAPIPLLAEKAGASMVGKRVNTAGMAHAAGLARDEAKPITDVRGTEAFRRDLVYVLTYRSLSRAAERIESNT